MTNSAKEKLVNKLNDLIGEQFSLERNQIKYSEINSMPHTGNVYRLDENMESHVFTFEKEGAQFKITISQLVFDDFFNSEINTKHFDANFEQLKKFISELNQQKSEVKITESENKSVKMIAEYN